MLCKTYIKNVFRLLLKETQCVFSSKKGLRILIHYYLCTSYKFKEGRLIVELSCINNSINVPPP